MNKLKELSIFYSPKELWCCRTRTLNAVSGTVEYHTHTGFITQTEAEQTLEETEAVFQKDLEAEFQMARSTASGILQAMEKKGLITRESIPRDARLKRLVLTEKGMEFQMEIMENFDRIQDVLKSDIPQEKLECFLEVLDMIRENAQRECCLRDEN